jgi:hypothetical protein
MFLKGTMMTAFKPTFVTAKPALFMTNNPLDTDRMSKPVVIIGLEYFEDTNTVVANCSDSRKRRCQLNRLTDDKFAEKMCKDLQKAYDKGTEVQFVAAGGNDPQVWFYNIVTAK